MQIPCCLDPKHRRKKLYGQLRQYLGQVFKDPAHARESEVLEGHMMADHVHMLISIPPKYAVPQVIGFSKGKSAIQIARNYLGHRRNFTGQQFWARGYHVSTVGRDEQAVREYIKAQEVEIRSLEVKRVGLFGSFLRGEQRADSDIDLLVEFRSGEKTFDSFMRLAFFLEELLGRSVELVTPESLSPYIGPHILEEVVYVSFGS